MCQRTGDIGIHLVESAQNFSDASFALGGGLRTSLDQIVFYHSILVVMYVLTCNMKAPVSIEAAFAVFESPYNLARITPPWLRFCITTPEQVVMRRGAEIEYRIRWLGLPVKWKTLVTEYDAPRMFKDEQARGPYRFWRH